MGLPRLRALVVTLVFALALVQACATTEEERPVGPPPPTASDVDALAARYWDALMARHPTWATLVGDHRFDDRLFETGPEARAAFLAVLAPIHDEARALQAALGASLDEQRRLTLALLVDEIEEEREAARLDLAALTIDQMDGPQATLPYFFTTQHPMSTARDVENLLARARAIPAHLDGLMEDLERGRAAGRTAPRLVVERVAAQLAALVTLDARDDPFVRAASRVPATLPDAAKKRAALESAAVDVVRPAFARLRAYLEETYLPAARPEPGVSTIPSGGEIYAHLARVHTTTTLAPDAIHQLGLDELARIEARMAELARGQGFAGGATEFLRALKDDPARRAPSREALLEAYRLALDDALRALPRAFTTLPKLKVEVREMDAERERDAPAAYYEPGSLVDGRPGIFIANLHRHDERPLVNARVLTFHEAVPGHHLQIALAQEQEALPRFRREGHYSAYVEGWALYGEQLAHELGLYPTVFDEMGYLGFAAWRAARLVVDTGLHHKGWTREHAIDFLAAHTTLGAVDVENEIDRYIAWPGQALAYMVGKLRIVALRARLEQALGTRFSLPAFHAALLETGPLPLDLVEEHVSARLGVKVD